jgi:hypothetical protein
MSFKLRNPALKMERLTKVGSIGQDDMKIETMKITRSAKWFFLLLVIIATARCGVVYKPAPFWGAGGYSSTDIDATTVKVSYLTARTADVITARNYALYRCAELTLERGYDRFIVLKDDASSIGGPYGYTTGATFVIQLYKGEAGIERTTGKGGQAYEAKALKTHLEPRIER